jgi:hypothetical protein
MVSIIGDQDCPMWPFICGGTTILYYIIYYRDIYYRDDDERDPLGAPDQSTGVVHIQLKRAILQNTTT